MLKNILLSLALIIASNFSFADKSSNLIFEDFYIVLPPPVATGTAAYGTITNIGTNTDTLLDIKSDLDGMLMLHKTEIESGMADMIHIDEYELKPNAKLTLKPMSFHLMFVGLKKNLLNEGQTINLFFKFKNAGIIKQQVTVIKPE